MKKHLPIMIFIILFLVSCESKENILKSNGGIEVTYKPKDNSFTTNQQNDLFLPIDILDHEQLNVSIDKVPILKSYIEQFEDKENEINRISSRFLYRNNQKNYILVNYSCGTKLCNQLFLEEKEGNIQSIQVSESSFLQDSKINNDYLAFLFGRNEGSEVVRNQVFIIRLKDFQKISPPDDLILLESFEYPIPMIEWKDEVLIATIANIDETSYEGIKQWYMNKQHSIQQIEWKINN
ncbi:hypothetical protein [Bacillus sp. S/N-304-OC-R1]|uniref:hypothetical protein n=1 Tax=Bacillus sp. S/N-304-OC-R1 TaxID=2758034 RepID=UPI001C8ED40E|nr:hypothetical protein [Bacillus sp. S/N-304-OC-R1]MBY0121654.1 hypothetical protein [Bacillus sp. S/N-304-OC-R1]